MAFASAGDRRGRFFEASREVHPAVPGGGRGWTVVSADDVRRSAPTFRTNSTTHSSANPATTLHWQTTLPDQNVLRNLIGVLSVVRPDIVMDTAFLEKSILVLSTDPSISPSDLMDRLFPTLDVNAAVLVRDCETSERVGLVVFHNARDACLAMNLPPCPGLRPIPEYIGHDTPEIVREASVDAWIRELTANTMRSLIPVQYLENDPSMDFHLRCIFLRGSSVVDLSKGVYNLCRVAESILSAKGTLCAAVVSEPLDAANLVYDEVQSTDKVCLSASRLRAGSVKVYDSSLFPMPAGDTTGGSSEDGNESDRMEECESDNTVRGMLPKLFTRPEYVGCVVVLRWIKPREDGNESASMEECESDSMECDVREIAYYLVGFKVEALYAYRAQRRVIAVFGSEQDARLVRQRSRRVWVRDCGRSFMFMSVTSPYPGVSQRTMDLVSRLITVSIDRFSLENTHWIAEGLTKLAFLKNPDVVWHNDFLNRAVILLGIHADVRDSELRSALRITVGEPKVLVLHCQNTMGVALAVFKTRKEATKLLRQPAETSNVFSHCRPVPRTVDTAHVVDTVSHMVFVIEESHTQPGGWLIAAWHHWYLL